MNKPKPTRLATSIQPNKSWANITEDRVHRAPTRLDYFPPLGTLSDIPFVQLPGGVIEKCTEFWKNTLVGYFIEKRFPFPVVQNIAKKMWQRHGLIEVLSNNCGFFFFRFDSLDNMLKIFDASPCHFVVAGCPVILKCWEPGMNISRESHTSVPIWIKNP